MLILLNKLKRYNLINLEEIKAKEQTISAATKMYNNRQKDIVAFQTGIFPYIDGFKIEEESE